MEMDYALVADAAQITDNKLFMLGGGFDVIFAPQLPVVYSKMSIAFRILFTPAEVGAKTLMMTIMDEDGKKHSEVNMSFNLSLNKPAPPGKKLGFQAVLDTNNLKFDKFGHYQIDFVVNGIHLKSIPLDVVQRD